jgi:hypothetical protein
MGGKFASYALLLFTSDPVRHSSRLQWDWLYLHGQQLGESLEDRARRATVYAWSRLESLTPTLPQGDALSERLERVRVEET